MRKFGKIAIVHDDLVAYGGGEVVLKTLTEIFPNSDCYTSFIDYSVFKKLDISKKIQTGWLQRIKFIKAKPRLLQILSPFYWPFLNLQKYDLVITHGTFYLSNVVNLFKKSSTLAVYYSMSPPKNLYFKNHRVWWEEPLNLFYYPFLRFLDNKALKNTDLILSVSNDVKKRIKKIYKRDSRVIYPPVNIPKDPPSDNGKREYYLYVGRLSREKNLELLIKAFNINVLPLFVVGTGPEEEKLKSLANHNISFLGFKTGAELRKIYAKAKAFVHLAPSDDFPLSPIEALGSGVPIIAPISGGTKEAIVPGKTGIIFSKMNVDSINKTVYLSEKTKFDYFLCYKTAKKYSKERFKSEFLKEIAYAFKKHSLSS